MRTPPLLADFIHARACKSIYAKLLTLPMMSLDLSADNPAWTVITAEEQIRRARDGHASLHERYGVEDPIAPKTHAKELDRMFTPQEPDPVREAMVQVLREVVRISMETVWPKEDS